ncbi:MAG: class I SAM-dependent methyltransferase [Candidatus Omnitrophota bacterium]
MNKRDFNKEATAWDDNPIRVQLANDIYKRISQEVVLMPTMDIMDFGCGTGLMTLQFKPLVRSITGFDSSEGMLEVFKDKVVQKNLSGVEVYHIDLEKGECLKGQYHLIVSSMTFHHIMDIPALLDQFYKLLQPSGYLCIADLDSDEGKFHDNNDGVFHQGFDRLSLSGHFKEAGFEDVRDVQATEVVKMGSDGITRKFSIFLMMGQKV